MKVTLRITALFCLQFAAIAQPIQTQHLQGHVPPAVANLTAAGRLNGDLELKLAIGLPLRNKEGLTNLLQRLYDPAGSDYHHFLTPAQFTEKFGPTEEDYRAVTAFANANGLKVTATHPNRTLLDVSGSVSSIEKAFHVTMRMYRHPRENREFYAPDAEPSLDLATPVLHISGLDNYLLPHPMSLRKAPQGGTAGFVPALGSGPVGAYLGADFRAAYAPGLTLDGTGQMVGLLEFDGYYAGDISSYASIAGVPAVPLENVYLDEFDGTPGTNNVEVALDIDMAICMAPGLASVVVYEGEVTDDILNRMATDDLANQLSASWTYPIDSGTDQIFQQFAAQGQSFFNAAGDGDAWVGNIATPCDDPNITSVGGTTLTTTGPGGAWVSETVWNWDIEYGRNYNGVGGGGGISTTYTIPSWQLNVNMTASQGSTSFRNIPDVAMTADNVFVVADNGQEENVGGTSCATPLWAAFIALANEQALINGRPTLGFINPAIYTLGLGVNYTNCFHDITTGNNTWSESPSLFDAVPGYDLCTGWGTPIGSNLVNLLALDSLQISPLGLWASGGTVGGPLTPASQDYVLTNIGTAPLNWAAGATAPWLTVSLDHGTITPGGAAATILVSMNAAASNLFLGTYDATIWFTNLTDGSVQSRAVSLAIIKPPEINEQPTNLEVIGGTTAAFTASAAGGLPLTFQWQSNGVNLANGGRISGTQSTLTDSGNIYGSGVSTLSISSVAATDAGTYALVASNAAGAVVSSSVILTISPSGPVIVQQPASRTVLVGATAQLTVGTDGSAPFGYQWQQNGTSLADGGAISGSLTQTLTINSASSANIGSYTVIVSNSLGMSTSAVAVLTVQVAVPGGQLVQNGGFENGNFSPWIETSNSAGASVSGSSTAVYSGNYGALLGAAGSLGYLSQSVPTVAGQSYLLSLWLDSPDGISPNEFSVSWNGTVMFDQTNLGAIGWTNLQFFVMATETNTLLQFGFRDDTSFLGLDNIQVIPLVTADGPTIIAAQPASQILLQGGTGTFSVLSSGALPLLYQWQFNGTNLNGATNATLTLSNLTTSQTGTYDVLVSNSLGSAASSNALLTVLTGQPEFITFDDLPYRLLPVPAGYNNLTWSNFYYLNGVVGRISGYFAGMVSVPKVAYNNGGTPAAITASAPFILYSAYMTAAWNDNMQVQVEAYNGSTLSYSNTYTLSATTPTLINFNYVDVTSVQFNSFGGTPHPGYGGSGLEFVMDNVSVYAVPLPPQPPLPPISVMYSFDGFDGGRPFSQLIQATDGNFYGTTTYGGTNGYGTVFRMTTNGIVTTLHSFDAFTATPFGPLVQASNGTFYGTTEYGGTDGDGTVFSMTTNGIVSALASFNYNVTGAYPAVALVQGVDGNLYGVTAFGGTSGVGTVFRVTTNGTLNALVSFDNTNGANPYGALVLGANGIFYGDTFEGGASGVGTVFSITTNGTMTTLLSLNGSDEYPYGGLVLGSDGNLYGTSEYGGTNGYGEVFSITTNGTLSALASFNYDVSGGYPSATLIQGTDGNFYGTTSSGGSFGTLYSGGTYGGGTVFSISTNGTLTTLFSFENTNGLFTQSSLMQGADGYFYGTTPFGGVGFNGYQDSGDGVIFRVGFAPTTTPPAIVVQPVNQMVPLSGTASFSVNATGATQLTYAWQRNGDPIAGATQSTYSTNDVQLTESGDRFSCMISDANGSIASSNAVLTVFNTTGDLHMFLGTDAGYPSAPLIQATDGNYYGTTQYGGTYGDGAVFKVTTNGTFSVLASLNYYLSGANPLAGLVEGADGNFYGTATYGGLHNAGTVFRVTPSGTLTTILSFDTSNGAEPDGSLVLAENGYFYGTSFSGGANGYGTVFRVTTNGTVTTLFSFSDSNGAYPQGGLMQGADGLLYGTASSGGASGDGTVFKITTNGALTTLVSFNGANGAYPQDGLVQAADGNFYGTTTEGGTSNYGTLFRMTPIGGLTTLFLFEGTNGFGPQGGLALASDGNLYGTTTQGGTNGYGTAFSMSTNGALTNLLSFQGTNGSFPSAALVQGSDGNLYGITTEGGIGFDGLYWSGNGAVFRLTGTFTYTAPMVVTQPAGETVPAGGTASFSVAASGTTPLSYLWQRNGVAIPGATLSSYLTNNVQLSDSGALFSCLVSNAYGSTVSSNATLIVVAGTPGLITFDDLIGTSQQVPVGYHNLTWSNFYYLNGVAYGGPSGFNAGVVSTNNAAYNNGGAPAAIISSAQFNLLSAYLTAAWNDNLQVEAQGYNGSALTYDNTYTLSATNPTLIAFNYVGVTLVQFTASGGTHHTGYAGNGNEFVMDNVTLVPTPLPPPQPKPLPIASLYSFDGFDGGHPSSSMIQGTDGNFYGTTEYGGTQQDGTVFKMTTNGALTTLVSFDGANGAQPYGALVEGTDGFFYGTTEYGGTQQDGTAFKIAANGALTSLTSFGGANGAEPYGALVQGTDGNFYGTTIGGGAYGGGTVFRITTNGTLTSLLSFNIFNGTHPYGGLVQGQDGNFYGTTKNGGANDYGMAFSITTNGTLSVLASFSYAATGGYPSAALVEGMDGNFYGTTEYGGTNGYGGVFRMTAGGALTTLFSFDNSNGAYPQSALVQGADGFFYGTTEYGGTNDSGTVFGMTTNGTVVSLFSFRSTNGLQPLAGLVQGADGYFYGTASYGGVGFNGASLSGDGIVFRLGTASTNTPPAIAAQPVPQIVPVGGAPFFSVSARGAAPLSYSWQRNDNPIAGATQSSYTTNHVQLTDSGDEFTCLVSNSHGSATSSSAALITFEASGALFSFDGPDGGWPSAALIQAADGNFYGTTTYGGIGDSGTVFKMNTNGLLDTLVSFNLTNGAQPGAALIQGVDGSFYGTTAYGGTGNYGTVFKMTTNGTLTTLLSFSNSDGAAPYGALVEGSDGYLYGTTEGGGTNGDGTAFKMATNGTLAATFSFDGADGAAPYGPLVQGSDGNFYGTTQDGGTNNYGTVFRVTTNVALTSLYSFQNFDGAYPQDGLVQGTNGIFYGVTTQGGTSGQGTVFSMTTNGVFTNLYSFQAAGGSYPRGGLAQGNDGNFYGATTQGGTYGLGTVFGMDTNGAVTSLFSFEGANGSSPSAALIQGRDGNFYGTATYGGVGYDGINASGNGTVFRLAVAFAPSAPLIVTQPASQTTQVGGAATFSVTAASSTPLSYLWQRDGTNIAGATLSTYTTNNVQLPDSGTLFSCLVSNAYGATLSSNASLTVTPAGTPGLITFDDLAGTSLPVPAGYFNLTWSNFYYLNGVAYSGPSGFNAGVVSTKNVGYNNSIPAVVSCSAPFALLSAYLTAAWNDNLQVEVQGYSGSTLSYDNTYTLSATAATLVTFNYVDVTSVHFIPSGGTHHTGYAGTGSEFVVDNVNVVVPAPGPPPSMPTPMPITALYSFDGFDGGHPSSALIQGTDGNFYGTTEYGGAYENGTVFKMTTNGALTTLVSFDGANGAQPYGALAQDTDGTLYGTTTTGGASGDGTVFSVAIDGTLTTLASFNGTNGTHPNGGLTLGSDGNFYGITRDGGTNGYGAVFSVSTAGNISVLASFNYATTGGNPLAALVQATDGSFYGTTENGGTNDYGTVFNVTTNGALTALVSFNNSNGAHPQAALVEGMDGNFYGTTEYGGTNGYGGVFRMTAGGALTTLFSFDNSNGAYPQSALVQGADGFFYGTTEYGGTNDSGTVFGMTTNGTVVSLFSFRSTNGLQPLAGLVQGADGYFYGTASYGGVGFNGASLSGDGIVFRLGTASTNTPPAIAAQPVPQIVPVGGAPFFSVSARGAAPLSYSWQRNDNPIAGATQSSYTTNHVQLTDSGDEFTCLVSNSHGSATSSSAALITFEASGALFSFDGPDGGWPSAALIQAADGNFYGTTTYGGIGDSGTVFKMNTNGLLDTLVSFNLTNGAQPGAALIQGVDGSFYGTTAYGGTGNYGTVFKMTTNGTLTTLLSFSNSDGAAPYGALVEGSDGYLYGTTEGGGTNGDGTAFKMATNGTLAATFSFDGADGAAPYGPLVQGSDGNFYGTTQDGGTNNYGTVFRVTTNVALTSLYSFQNFDGAYPQDGLVQGTNGIFYGVTTQGGTSGQGTVFSMTTNGVFTNLYSFQAAGGSYPRGGLAQGNDGNFYGATTQGGTYGLGTVFGMDTNGAVTSLFSFEGANGSSPSAALIQGRDGNFYGTATYGGVGYDGINASGNGTVFRLAVAFAPSAPLIVTQPASQTTQVGGAATFSVTAASSTPLSYLWQRDGTNIAGATLSTYTTNNVQLPDSGTLFSCLVSNAYGATLSSNATLTVTPASLVQNGGFELGSFADWTTSGNFEDCSVSSVAPYVHSGVYGGELGPVGSLGYLSQTIPTVAGETYQISCWLDCDGQTPNEFLVAWNGVTLFDQQNLGNTSWANLQFNAAATSTSTVLTFGSRDDPSYFGIDDIAVYPIGFSGGSPTLAPTTVTLASGANPSTYGTPVTFTATVFTNGVPAGGISGEPITFYGGAVQLGTTTLNASGHAIYTTAATQLGAGNSSITAAYGGDANYAASTNSPALSQSVNLATVTAGLTGAVSRNYNGTVAATLTAANYTLFGVFAGDSVTLNNPASGAYDTRNQGAGKNVTVTGLALLGASAGNYKLSSHSVSGAVGAITQTNITITATGNTKTYDGTTSSAAVPAITSGGVQSGDTANFTDTYSTKFAGTGLTITPSGLVSDGNSGINYIYSFVNNASGIINPATLTYTANPVSIPYGSVIPPLTGSATGFVAGENQGNSTTGTVAFTTAATPTSSVGSYAISGSGLTANNGDYMFAQAAGNAVALTITQAIPLVTWTNPAPVTPGTILSSNQLDATANVPGSFDYAPTNGTVLNAGIYTLTAVFTPTDAVDYSIVTNTVRLAVSSPSVVLPVIQTAIQSGNSFTFTWSATSNQDYQIQTSTDLTQTTWTTVGGTITATNSTMTNSEPIGANALQFYRIVLTP